MKQPKILTFGSCGWDRIFYKNDDGSLDLIYEEEGRKNSHQAVAAKRAGAEISTLVSFVGDDQIGSKCIESLNNCGIDTKYVKVVAGQSTEVNHQYVDRQTGEYELERFASPLSQNYSAATVEKYKDEILNADFVILVSKQPHDFLTAIINFCYENDIKTVLTISHKKFDIENKKDLDTLRKCTFIAGNIEEAETLTNKASIEHMYDILPNLIITQGGDGVFFYENGKVCHEDAVKAEKVVETNGAGDTFIGNVIVFFNESGNIRESIRKGMCASTIKISKMGCLSAMPHRKETEALYNSYYNIK